LGRPAALGDEGLRPVDLDFLLDLVAVGILDGWALKPGVELVGFDPEVFLQNLGF